MLRAAHLLHVRGWLVTACPMQQGVLSKLSAAKELMAEILSRDKRKAAEREAEKAAAAKDTEKKEEEAGANVAA